MKWNIINFHFSVFICQCARKKFVFDLFNWFVWHKSSQVNYSYGNRWRWDCNIHSPPLMNCRRKIQVIESGILNIGQTGMIDISIKIAESEISNMRWMFSLHRFMVVIGPSMKVVRRLICNHRKSKETFFYTRETLLKNWYCYEKNHRW